jgi:rhodanese-related sulfurtransferase
MVNKDKATNKKIHKKISRGAWALWGTLVLLFVVVLVFYLLNQKPQTIKTQQQPTQTIQTQQTSQVQPAQPQPTSLQVPTGLSPEGTIALTQAFLMYQNGAAIFLDVREPAEFALYRIPGSVSIPLAELTTRIGEVALDKDVVIICKLSDECMNARDLLGNAGFTRLYPMADGIENWVLQRYPFEGAFPY